MYSNMLFGCNQQHTRHKTTRTLEKWQALCAISTTAASYMNKGFVYLMTYLLSVKYVAEFRQYFNHFESVPY